MPLKIGNAFVVSLHRPDWQKRLLPTEKDEYEANERPALLPERRAKPALELRRVTPYNRLPSASAVERALRKIPETTTAAQAAATMLRQLQAHVLMRGMPRLLLLGDDHGDYGSLPMSLALLNAVAGQVPGPKMLMSEFPPDWVRQANPPHDREAAHFSNKLRRDRPVRFLPGVAANPNLVKMRTNALFARHLGFSLHGFDTQAFTARHQEMRENAMLASIANAAGNQQCAIVISGSHHLPFLHESLAPQLNTFAAVQLGTVFPEDSDNTRRMSYLLTQPDIVKLRPDAALNGTPLDAIRFINHTLGGPAA